jgi:glucose/arabinose dehydrogenase
MVRLLQRFIPIFVALALGTGASHAQPFRVDTLVRGPSTLFPVALSFLPGQAGAFLFGERSTGRVMEYSNGLQPAPLFTIPVESDDGQGLLGLAVDPSYPDSPFVTVFSVRLRDRASVVERYRLRDGRADTSRLLLFIPRRDELTAHNGGMLAFGPDGKLYVAVGDHDFRPGNAQDTLGGRNPRGKLLRLNPDGTIPSDNPLPRRNIWALGLRSPGGLAFDAESGRAFITEGGADRPNAIIEVPRGANLGWPDREPCALPGGAPPRVLYRFPEGDQPGLTGITLYRGDAFPCWRGSFLFTGSMDPTLWLGEWDPAADTMRIHPLFHSNTELSDVKVGPDGNVYLIVGPYLGSRIFRISPIAPRLVSSPPSDAMQGVEYRYEPVCEGTPPEYILRTAPAGMSIDAGSGRITWIPTNEQALAESVDFELVARNGAGESVQKIAVRVQNVNDPPGVPQPIFPAEGTELRTSGADVQTVFSWLPASDPDGDSLQYRLELDTIPSFSSSARHVMLAGHSDSVVVFLPPVTRSWYWRVSAFDGEISSRGDLQVMHLTVVSTKLFTTEHFLPAESLLEQNYPNPFNPNTSIRYTLPHPGHVRLSVFNLIGQEVARLVDGQQTEGTHEVEFANVGLPSGIYFYRLAAPGYAETKKMVIAK